MFPMGYYDYGYGLGFGMGSVPPPAVVNHQADEHVYVAHEESGDTATIALLSFAALGSLAGLLIAHKANNATKLVDAVTHDLRATAEKGADEILNAAKKKASDTDKYAERIKDSAHYDARGIRQAAAEDAKALKDLVAEHQGKINELNGLIAQNNTTKAELGTKHAKLDELIAGTNSKQAELDRLIADAKKPATGAASSSAPVTNPIAEAGVPDPKHVDTLKGYSTQDSKAAEVLNGTPRQINKAVKKALRDAGKGSDAAVDLYNEGKYAEALPLFEESVKGYELAKQAGKLEEAHIPQYAGSLYNAGRCHQESGNFGVAIGYYDKLLNVIPEDIEVLLRKAECHTKLGQSEEAVKCYEVAANAGDETSMSKLSAIKFNQKSYKEAAEWNQKLADKGNPDGVYGLAHLTEHGLGVDQDYLKACNLYKQALELYIPMVEGKPSVIEQLKSLNEKLGSEKSNKHFSHINLKQEQIDALNPHDRAVREFFINEDLSILLSKAKNIIEGKPVTEGSAVAAKATGDAAGSAARPVSARVNTDAPTQGFVRPGEDAQTLADPPNPVMSGAPGEPVTIAPEDVHIGLGDTVPPSTASVPRDTVVDTNLGESGLPQPVQPGEAVVAAEESAYKSAQTSIEHASANVPFPAKIDQKALLPDARLEFETADGGMIIFCPDTIRKGEYRYSRYRAPLSAGEKPVLEYSVIYDNNGNFLRGKKFQEGCLMPLDVRPDGAIEAAANAERAGEEEALNAMAEDLEAHAGGQIDEALGNLHVESPQGASTAGAPVPQTVISDLPTPVMAHEANAANEAAAAQAKQDLAQTAEIDPKHLQGLLGNEMPHVDAGVVTGEARTAVDPDASRGLSGVDTLVGKPTDTLVGKSVPQDSQAGLKMFDGQPLDTGAQQATETGERMFNTTPGKAEVVPEAGATAAKAAELTEQAAKNLADAKKGVDAYLSGDYKTAIDLLNPVVLSDGEGIDAKMAQDVLDALPESYGRYLKSDSFLNAPTEVHAEYYGKWADLLLDMHKDRVADVTTELSELAQDLSGNAEFQPIVQKIKTALNIQ